VVDTEERLGPVDGQRLDLVDELLALVIALAGVALRVFVGQHGAAGLEHGRRHVVLGRDHPQLVVLALGLLLDEAGQLRVGGGQVGDRWFVHEVLRLPCLLTPHPGARCVVSVAPRWSVPPRWRQSRNRP
jgi:hypothetical protein